MKFKPSSLAQLFEPPEGYRGVFGWLCGYSADSGFLEDAIERFSGLTRAQRSYLGKVMLGVMLDPGNPQILPADAHGVLHIPAKSEELPFKFRLLHAKIGILAFERAEEHILRVIVSTGNWTRETLEQSLDLAWHFDVASKTDKPIEIAQQESVDLAAAWSFLSWIRQLFDARSIDSAAISDNQSATAAGRLDLWATELGRKHKNYRPRFFDNRADSFLRQLPDLIKRHAGETARNYLAMGSGFYESVGSKDPNVPESILARLREDRLLTATCDKNIFVNPFACQSIATSRSWIEEKGWTIRCARAPSYFGTAPRSLHAKFLFGANYREGSNNCSSPWVYIGSGNLTNPGFNRKAGSAGNLEAGVVLAPSNLEWEGEPDADNIVTALLPIHWEDQNDNPLPMLAPGEDMPDREIAFRAAPISLFLWEESSDQKWLAPQGEAIGSFQVIDLDGNACEVLEDGRFVWNAPRPRHVVVSWQSGEETYKAAIPVIDIYGRFCAAEFPSLDLEQAWTQLANFPMPPDDEELADGDAQTTVDGVTSVDDKMQPRSSVYPVRRMMTLVEDIAVKQANISRSDWAIWCNRLEQVLVQSKDSPDVKTFREIGINPLYPLLQSGFRPAFAATESSAEGARYETALRKVVQAWDLADQRALEGLS